MSSHCCLHFYRSGGAETDPDYGSEICVPLLYVLDMATKRRDLFRKKPGFQWNDEKQWSITWSRRRRVRVTRYINTTVVLLAAAASSVSPPTLINQDERWGKSQKKEKKESVPLFGPLFFRVLSPSSSSSSSSIGCMDPMMCDFHSLFFLLCFVGTAARLAPATPWSVTSWMDNCDLWENISDHLKNSSHPSSTPSQTQSALVKKTGRKRRERGKNEAR